MRYAHEVINRKLGEHSDLTPKVIAEISALNVGIRDLRAGEDFIRQGDRPDAIAVVLSGMVARYHLLEDGGRQYLSFHMTGDLPDAQGLFIDQMDHAVCAVGSATVGTVTHRELTAAFKRCPELGFFIWRETLIDASIFRNSITNNSSRSVVTRMAHLFCELFYRGAASGLTKDSTLAVPISLMQLGETLGMSLATVNRALAELRASGLMEFRGGVLTVFDWTGLKQRSQFDPHYLHLRNAPQI